ncbi:phosphatidate cytidylyltransferase [soil metagenome]
MTSSPPVKSSDAKPKAKGFDWPNLRLRLLSAAVLVPVALGCVWAGGWAYLILLAVAIALLASEWAKMCSPEVVSRSGALIAACVLAALLLAFNSRVSVGWAALVVAALLAALAARIAGWSPRSPDVGFGVVYLGAPTLALWWLRLSLDGVSSPSGPNDGFWWTALLLVSTWAADIFAFLGGSVLKGPKLWPRISPNKTWSGFICGLLASSLAAVALWFWLWKGLELSAPAAAAVGLAAGVATMGGDLLESMLKRRFGVKDSGDLIPGHGGLLDRVDGLMSAALVVAGARLLVQAGWLR